MDEIADALGLDPIELRLKNLKRDGDCWLGGQPIESNGVTECLEKVRAISGWSSERRAARNGESRRALGIGPAPAAPRGVLHPQLDPGKVAGVRLDAGVDAQRAEL